MTMPRRRRHGLGPPAVRPVDVDGVRTVAVGTVLWAITFVVLVLFRDDLDAEGVGWWLWTCLAGVGLGLLGLEYTRKRRDAIARARLGEEADREDEPVLAEPEAGSVEPEPMRMEPEPARAGRESVRVDPAAVRAKRGSARAEPEPARAAGPEPVRVEEPEQLRVEPELVRADRQPVPLQPEVVPTEPDTPFTAEIGPPAGPDPEPPEVTTSEWAQAGLLDVEPPPVPGPGSPSRRARRATRTDEPFDDPDEPLLPIRDDWRRVDDGPTASREIRDDATNEDEMDEGGYRGRRARRP
jgi:Protein of unknown function (DUF2530)